MKIYKIDKKRGEAIREKIRCWDAKRKMKKTIKGWAVVDMDGDILFRTVARTRAFSMIELCTAPVIEHWKYFYRKGYRIRHITITWEE